MLFNKVSWPIAAAEVLLALGLAHAGEKSSGESAPTNPTPPSAQEIAQWITQLDADKFSERETAQAKLAAAGKAALAELAKAAVGDSLEVTVRAMNLLKKSYESPDEATRAAAKQALESIAKGNRQAAVRRAEQILKPAPKPDESPSGGGIIFGAGRGGFGIVQGNIQVMAVAGAATATKKVSVKNTNGVKDTDVEEDGKKIQIHDDPQQGIKIEVTSKKNGKDATEKYEAKDAEELKKKHPEGYKVYQEYGEKQTGQVQIQLRIAGNAAALATPQAPAQQQPPPAAVPLAAPPPVAPPAAPPPLRASDAEAKRLSGIITRFRHQVETAGKNSVLDEMPKEAKEDLKQKLSALKQPLADLEKRLGEDAKKPAEKTQP